MNKKTALIGFFLVFATLVFLNCDLTAALAQNTPDQILPEPGGPLTKPCKSQNNCGNYSLNDFMLLAVNVSDWILGIVGSLALLFFIYGGFMFTMSAGVSDRVDKGKKILFGAIVGLVLVFTSYIIIQFSMEAIGFKKEDGKWSNLEEGLKWEDKTTPNTPAKTSPPSTNKLP